MGTQPSGAGVPSTSRGMAVESRDAMPGGTLIVTSEKAGLIYTGVVGFCARIDEPDLIHFDFFVGIECRAIDNLSPFLQIIADMDGGPEPI